MVWQISINVINFLSIALKGSLTVKRKKKYNDTITHESMIASDSKPVYIINAVIEMSCYVVGWMGLTSDTGVECVLYYD